MPDEGGLVCAFTNVRNSVQLTVDKQWVEAVFGDTTTIEAAGGDPSQPSGAVNRSGPTVSTSEGDNLDEAVVSIEVYAGEEGVTVSEVLGVGNMAAYTTQLDCPGVENLQWDPATGTGTFDIPADVADDITCTFTNTAHRATIVVNKLVETTVEGAEGTFDFRASWLGGIFVIPTNEEGVGSVPFYDIVVPVDPDARYALSEVDPRPDYDGTDLTCESDMDGNLTSIDPATLSADIHVRDGETVECTFTNTQRATIVITKDAQPDDDQDFDFKFTGSPSELYTFDDTPIEFTLDDDPASVTVPNEWTSPLLPANRNGATYTYTVEELGVTGWSLDLAQSTCTNGVSFDDDGTVSISPEPGSVTRCTFVNTAATSQVTFAKDVSNVNADFAWGPFELMILDADGNRVGDAVEISGTGPNTVTAAAPLTGLVLNETYTFVESEPPAGWANTSLSCAIDGETLDDLVPDTDDPATHGFQFKVTEPGSAFTCTATNLARSGRITVTKTVEGFDGDWSFNFTLIDHTDSTRTIDFTLTNDDPATAADESMFVFDELRPGDEYELVEPSVPGWESDVVCRVVEPDGTESPLLPGDGGIVRPGLHFICDVTNTEILPQLTLLKTVDNSGTGADAVDTDWTLTATGPTAGVTGVEGDAAITSADVEPGVYTLSEVANDPAVGAYYSAGDWSCTGTSADGTDTTFTLTDANELTLGRGDVVECVIVNTAVAGTFTYTKSVDPGDGSTVEPGDTVEYSLTVTHTGGAPLDDVLIIDDLSDVLDNASLAPIAAPAGTTAELAADGVTLEWTISTLAPGDVLTLTYQVTVSADQWGESLRNVVTSTGGDCVEDCDTENPIPHYTLAKSSDPVDGSTVAPGDSIAYTLTVTNDSDAVVSGMSVTDDLSGVLANATWDGAFSYGGVTTGSSASVSGSTLTWTLPELQPGESATVTYQVTVNDGAWGVTLANVATPGDGGECEVDCKTEHPTPHFLLNKESDPASPSNLELPGAIGSTVVYTLTVTNDSDAVLTGASVTDDLSNVLSAADLDPMFTYGGDVTEGSSATVAGTVLTWALPELQPGEVTTLSYRVTINDQALDEASIRNVATPSEQGECVVCTTVHDFLEPLQNPEWTLAKESDPPSGATVEPGDTVTYTLTITNTNTELVPSVLVTDDLTDVVDNATLVTPLDGGLSFDTATNTLEWLSPEVPVGGSVSVSYQVVVDPDQWNESLVNVATDGRDTPTTAHPTPGYEISKTSDPADGTPVAPGDAVTYTLTATNTSDAVLEGATATDDLSDVLDNADLGTIGDGLTLDGTTLTWSIPTLLPGEVATVSYTVTVTADEPNQVLYNVVTPGDGGVCDPVTGCDTEHEVPFEPVEQPSFSLNKSSDPVTGTEVKPGQVVTYTLTVRNDGPVALDGQHVYDDISDVIDNAVLLGSPPAGVSLSGSIITWALPRIEPGASASISYQVQVRAGASGGALRNLAYPDKDEAVGTCENCTTVHPIPVVRKPGLPFTGGNVGPMIALATGLLAAGALLVGGAHRRRQAAQQP